MSHARRLAAAVLALSLIALVAGCGDDDDGPPPGGDPTGRPTSGGEPIGPANEGIDGVQAFRVASNAHTGDDLDYDHRPPVGGDHYPVPATCGFYPAEPADEVPPDELLVHSLEHGAVWIAYQPDAGEDVTSALSELAGTQRKVIVTPYDGLESTLVVTAWARQLELQNPADPRLVQFIDRYREADTAPEPRNACQGAGNPTVVSPP